MVCPECGSDLREVGIRVGQESGGSRTSVAVLALIWAVLIWIAGTAVMTAIEQMPLHWARMNLSAQFQAPDSKAYRSIGVQAIGDCRTDQPLSIPPIPRHTLILLANDGSQSRLELDFAARTYSIGGGPPTPTRAPINAQTIANWMKGIGIDTSTNEVKTEIAAILASIQMPRYVQRRGSWSSSSSGSGSGTGFGNVSQNSSGRTIERVWPLPVLAVAGLFAWLLGVRWMARRFGPRG